MAIKVRAIVPGVYGHLREVGEVFEIANETAFSKRWMVQVADDVDDKPTPRKRRDGPTPEQVAAEEAEALQREVRPPAKSEDDEDDDDEPVVARRTRRR